MPIAIEIENPHPATELALEALQWLHERRDFSAILDMGCGNGILAMTAASVWDARALAVDVSPKAVEDARRNIAAHGLENRVTARRSDGFSDPGIRQNGPYDLILFNLLAEPIVDMAPSVKSCLTEGGICIIGGVLSWKAEGTKKAYIDLGFEIINEFVKMPWHILLACHITLKQNIPM